VRLRVHWELRAADLQHLRAKGALHAERFNDASIAMTEALQHVGAANVRLDEALSWELGSDTAPPPHLAPLSEERERLSAYFEHLAEDVRGYQRRVDKLIKDTKRDMKGLREGRAGARSRMGEEAWTSNASRPGWTPSDPAERLAALNARLRELEALRGVLADAEVTLAGRPAGEGP
jgi:hypothetical protein